MLGREKALVPVRPENYSLTRERILGQDTGVVTFWFGKRDSEGNDLEIFRHMLYWSGCQTVAQFDIQDAEKIKRACPALMIVDFDIRQVFERNRFPLAVFIISTPQLAEYPWVTCMKEGLQELKSGQNKLPVFVYKIILGSYPPFEKRGRRDPGHHFSRNEMRAQELGGVYLPYNGDYPTLSTRRLVEFIERLMGFDLQSNEFPNYDPETVQRIAWHVNREDFNMDWPRDGAIPKYPIVNGRPVFAF